MPRWQRPEADAGGFGASRPVRNRTNPASGQSSSLSFWCARVSSSRAKFSSSLSPRRLGRRLPPTVISPPHSFSSSCIYSFGCFSSHQLHTPFTSPSPATSSPVPLPRKRGYKVTEASPTMSSLLETRQKISSRSITPPSFH